MADLVELTALKRFLGVDHTDDDDLLADLIDEVSAAIENYTGRIYEADGTARSEYISGGTKNLIVDKPPIASITGIYDTFNDDEEVDSDSYDYDPDSGMIYPSEAASVSTGLIWSGMWSYGRRRWKVTYKGGNYSAIPNDIVLAAKTWIADIYAYRDDLKSGSLGDQSFLRAGAIANHPMPDRVKGLLDKYTDINF